MPYFTHDETRFRYYDHEEQGLPVVFLHGIGASQRQPLELLEGLPDVRLLTLDFRGHGLTEYDGPPAGYQIRVFADDVVAMLDHAGVGRAVVGGVSLGAAVSLNLALRFPDRVRGLVLVRPAWLNQPFPINLDLLVRIGRWIETGNVESARARLLSDPNFREIRSRSQSAAESLLGQLRRPQVATAYPALMRLPASVPFIEWEEVGQLRVPVLILISRHDPLHPGGYGHKLADVLPDAELRYVTSRYDDPDRHRRELRGFVRRFLREKVGVGEEGEIE